MKPGQFAMHPVRPEWGTGQVEQVKGNKVTVNFEFAGPKTLDISIVHLERVEHAVPIKRKIDIARLEALCSRFQTELQSNRVGTDDGGMARVTLADVKRRGQPTETSKKRLLAWCHTEGTVFQPGVALAREICIVIYGAVLADPDKE
jgi:hypothetical protein